ncbi:sensor histidine kinase [Salinispira pacifica]|uniref:histidine kinase n=1 Tax=Salinispira pacifica TaxID=1307761 RepID=V5WDP0_9SPIO|nr:HAMP domain-containing sensor histidine kinase [Salinispira pacifica]AHC13902.1 Sensory box histidine kinase [Salinispira pacifica]
MKMIHRIQTKLFFIFLILALLTLGVSGLVFFTSYNSLLYRSEARGLERYLIEAGQVVSQGIEGNRWLGLNQNMRERLAGLSRFGRIRVSLLDSRGELIDDFSPAAPDSLWSEDVQIPLPGDFPRPAPGVGTSNRDNARHGMGMMSGESMMRMEHPNPMAAGRLFPGENSIGIQGHVGGITVQVFRDTRSGSALLMLASRGYIIAMLFAAGAAAGVSYLFGSKISGPVKELRDAAVLMAQGNYQVRAVVRGADEIAQLTDSFNHLAAEQERRIGELQQERDSLQRFLMDASHELRTPLTSLLTSSEILLEKAPNTDARLKKLQNENHESILRLKELVDRLLSMSRIQAGLDSLEPAEYSLEQLCKAPFRETASSSVTLYIIDPDFTVFADKLRFGQVLRNLIENAVHAGSKNIYISAFRSEDDSESLITVLDDGPGIPEEMQGEILHPFIRGEGSTGLGIGLSICSDIVRRQGGTLSLTSPVSEVIHVFPDGALPMYRVDAEKADDMKADDMKIEETNTGKILLREFLASLSIKRGSAAVVKLPASPVKKPDSV